MYSFSQASLGLVSPPKEPGPTPERSWRRHECPSSGSWFPHLGGKQERGALTGSGKSRKRWATESQPAIRVGAAPRACRSMPNVECELKPLRKRRWATEWLPRLRGGRGLDEQNYHRSRPSSNSGRFPHRAAGPALASQCVRALVGLNEHRPRTRLRGCLAGARQRPARVAGG